MKISTALVGLLLLIILSVFAISQGQTTSVSAEEKEECTTTYYTETEPVYAYVNRTSDRYGTCYDHSNSSYYPCINEIVHYQSYQEVSYRETTRNRTACRTTAFEIIITEGIRTHKKKIDFSSWGACKQEREGDCIAVICGNSKDGSAVNGVFTGCSGGRSCKKFLFCGDGTRVFIKNSQPDFVEEDPTYNLPPLDIQEVEQ